jgi:hypothetical protein
MKIKLVKFSDISGNKAGFYSIYYNNDKETLFEQFLKENVTLFKSELKAIVNNIETMGTEEGARFNYFRVEEGEPGDRICAILDEPNKKLRLYCIRFSDRLVLLGGGGYKPKNISSFQDDPKLKAENYKLRKIVKLIEKRMEEGEINLTNNGRDFSGSFVLKDDYFDE